MIRQMTAPIFARLSLAIPLILACSALVEAATHSNDAESHWTTLSEQAQEQGRVPVLIRLRTEDITETTASERTDSGLSGRSDGPARLRQRLRSVQPQWQRARQRIRAKLQRGTAKGTGFNHLPLLAMEVNREDLALLKASPDVLSIAPDRSLYPVLAQSMVRIGGPAPISGYNGQGQVVAILDTGVDLDHPAFSGRILGPEQACFSGINNSNSVSLCPTGLPDCVICPTGAPECTFDSPDSGRSACGSGAGANCSVDDDDPVCWHGTHVAGIATGAAVGSEPAGVAPGAQILPVQVFSLSDEGGSVATEASRDLQPAANQALVASTSDMLAAFDHLLDLKLNQGVNIAAVNMSVGTWETWSSTLACDAEAETVDSNKPSNPWWTPTSPLSWPQAIREIRTLCPFRAVCRM
jgi:subtilisin family serine protease